MKMISFDFIRLNARLFVAAHVFMLFIAVDHESTLLADSIKYVSSAHVTRWFPRVTALSSPASMTYDAGPMPDPCMILALMDFNVDV